MGIDRQLSSEPTPAGDARAVPEAIPPRGSGIIGRLFSIWTWRMAWRDSRASRRRLALFSSSIMLGIAALVAIGSLSENLRLAIEDQAKTLLGADLAISSRQPFTAEDEKLFKEIGGEQAREVEFSTMIYFPRVGGTRLAQARALSGGFPFYGQLETEPRDAAVEFRRTGGALVEESLLTQFDARVGDELRLGGLTTRVVGRLLKVPGESIAIATIAPRVYLRMEDLARTGLIRPGSLARFRVLARFDPGTDVAGLVRRLRPRFEVLRLGVTTVEERKRDLGQALENLHRFLNLAGFVALLLGGVGVASAIQVHLRQKLTTVALLRCLGCSVPQAFAIYLAQGAALGLLGAVVGAGLGIALQDGLWRAVGEFLSFHASMAIGWGAVARAMGIGLGICLLFAWMPLLAVRRVSPLAAIRVAFEPGAGQRDPWRWVAGACLAAGVLGFALSQARNWRIGLGFAAALGIVGASLAGTAKALILLARRVALPALPFTTRQGLANLHRPNNRTLLLLMSLGLGTFLMLSLYLAQRTLLTQLIPAHATNQPNAVLFDVQPDQRAGVIHLVESMRLPVLDEAPIVTMRLASVRGRTVQAILADLPRTIAPWALRREYRSTFSDHLRPGERVVAGQWQRQPSAGPVAPISVEAGLARELRLKLGDELEFDVQGVPVKTRVANLREVDWRRMQPNFFIVFPPGVLEAAPAMHVLVTRVPNAQVSARLQREIVKAFPNVSAMDVSLILQTLDSILGKIAFAVRFMAMFTVLTGLLVLASALVTGRYQRIQESVLLRTLGASRAQIRRILALEYVALGVLAALTGILLAVGANWAMARWVFRLPFVVEAAPLLIALALVPVVTVLVGLLTNRGVLDHPPLAVLCAERQSL